MLVKPNTRLVARMLIGQYGTAVRPMAALKAAELHDAGNTDGLAYWTRVMHAIDEELDALSPRVLH